MKPKLWIAPLAAHPRSDLLRDHRRPAAPGQGRHDTGRDLVEQLLSVPRLSADGGAQQGACPQDHGRMGLCRPQARRPASQRRRALLQSGAQARPARRVGREAAGFLEGDLCGGDLDQSGRGDRNLPVRHVAGLSQHAVYEPAGRLRSGVIVAGPAQGQDDQGADGAIDSLCGRPRGAQRQRR